ncbi:MAG: acyltransferase [Acidobacteria bacterium]|nr:acyltransferase [Acidobacteriota bacterium]
MPDPLAWLTARFELARGGKDRMAAMEGLRGLSAALVFFVHFDSILGQQAYGTSWISHPLRFLGAAGNTGVEIFFVISGFLIYDIVLAKFPGYGRFLWRRIVRIYPAFLAVFVIYAAAWIHGGAAGRKPPGWSAATYLAANLLMLPGVMPVEPLITVAWSLSFELAYYLSIPLLVAGLRMRSWTPAARATLFLAIGALYFSQRTHWYLQYPVFHFLAGAVLREFLRSQVRPLPDVVAVISGLASLAVVAWADNPPYRPILCAVSWLLLCHCGIAGSGFLNRFFTWRWIRWLGNMSYSYYLIHALPLHVIARIIGPVEPASTPVIATLLLAGFAATVAAAAALYLLVERRWSLRPGAVA